jgi:phospholipase C
MALDIKAKVDTIAILMLENRSFDHMFSFLSLDPANPRRDINGITSLRKRDHPNTSKTKAYYPWVTNDDPLVADLPHGRDLVDVQLKGPNPTANSAITMGGFVEAYRQQGNIRVVTKNAAPMAVQKRPWMMDYFAKRHLVCTQWFAPLPTDTQPNRLMALSGFTNFDTTKPRVINRKPLIYHWLSDRGIPWRVYRSGLPFEMLIKSMWNAVFDDKEFRSVNQLAIDVAEEDDATFPRVIFMEPAFADSPITLGYQPNDDHPPLPIAPGQQFMREMYMALNANPKRWAKTVMVITYDEHGGFYDHVTPLNVTTNKPAGARWSGGAFKTTGVRVPAIIASPLVKGGSVYDKPLDHTSILQFIASLLGDGKPYSDDLAARAAAGIGSVADALNRDEPRSVIPKPPENAPPVQVVGTLEAMAGDLAAGIVPKKGANARAFEDAARQLVKQRPADVKAKYPELIHWDKT